jgi:hypothetical protein
LYISPDQVLDIVAETSPAKPAEEPVIARKPRSESVITKELEDRLEGFDEWLNHQIDKTGKS